MIALVARLLGPKLARLAPFLVYGALIAALLFGLWWLRHDAYKDGERASDARWHQAIAKANHDFLEQKARADRLAADQRITDTIAVSRREGELRNAIASTPDSAPDAVRISLGCARLRQSGAYSSNPAALPAACRSSGGAQARPAS